MNSPRFLPSLALALAVPVLLALRPSVEEYDLTLKFEADQRFEFHETFTMDFALDEFSVLIDGASVVDEGALSMDLQVTSEIDMVETILDVRDGGPSKQRFEIKTMEGSIDGEVDAMGEGESLSEPLFDDLGGRTIEVSYDEDGVMAVIDVTPDVAQLEEEALAGFEAETHFADLLPTRPLELGGTFEISADWKDTARDLIADFDMSDMDPESASIALELIEFLLEAASFQGTGELAEVTNGVATLVYDMKGALAIDDLLGMLQGIVPSGELDELPPGIESQMNITLELTGKGLFDLELGQLTSLEIEGRYSMEFSGSADIEGTEASAEMLMTGAFAMQTTLTAL